MKSWRVIVIGLTAAILMSLPAVSSADMEKKEGDETFVKLLRDSAAALQASDEDLAAGLTDFADEEARELQGKDEKIGAENEAEEDDKEEMNEHRQAHFDILRDAAISLETSHPELAADLTKAAERTGKKIEEVQKEEAHEIPE